MYRCRKHGSLKGEANAHETCSSGSKSLVGSGSVDGYVGIPSDPRICVIGVKIGLKRTVILWRLNDRLELDIRLLRCYEHQAGLE